MKSGLIACRQVLRKASFNYLTRCGLQIAVPIFHTLYNNCLPLKPSSKQVTKKQFSHQFRYFFAEINPEMGELNSGRVVGAQMPG